jgi:hypothetical protein
MSEVTFKIIVGVVLRGAVMALAGWLGAHGLMPAGNTEEWVGAVVLAGLTILWSLWQKAEERIKLKTALDLPPGATEKKLMEKIANGDGATLAEAIKS